MNNRLKLEDIFNEKVRMMQVDSYLERGTNVEQLDFSAFDKFMNGPFPS